MDRTQAIIEAELERVYSKLSRAYWEAANLLRQKAKLEGYPADAPPPRGDEGE